MFSKKVNHYGGINTLITNNLSKNINKLNYRFTYYND